MRPISQEISLTIIFHRAENLEQLQILFFVEYFRCFVVVPQEGQHEAEHLRGERGN